MITKKVIINWQIMSPFTLVKRYKVRSDELSVYSSVAFEKNANRGT